MQHKWYGVLRLLVSVVDWLRRAGKLTQTWHELPLSAFTVIGGLLLLAHSHGTHPAAHQIAQHHAIMAAMAVAAGFSRLVCW